MFAVGGFAFDTLNLEICVDGHDEILKRIVGASFIAHFVMAQLVSGQLNPPKLRLSAHPYDLF
jgi:hypothetical protein